MATLPTRQRVAVVGAGIMGLPIANLLTQLSSEPEVTLIAEEFSPNITSDVAAGLVWPTDDANLGCLDPRREQWTRTTFKYLCELFTSPLAGELDLTLLPVYALATPTDGIDTTPWWTDCVFGYRVVDRAETEALGYPPCEKCESFLVFMWPCAKYLARQLDEFRGRNGGTVLKKKLHSLQELEGRYDVIVNCAGLGSKELVEDNSVYPVRGQMVAVKAPWIKHATIYTTEEQKELKYSTILPSGDQVLLGSTLEVGNWSTQPDPLTRQDLIRKCTRLMPSLATAKVIKDVVGLRPARKEGVRLEVEEMDGAMVVHNYGHGGQGVTFSRGCALETVRLVEDCLLRKGRKH